MSSSENLGRHPKGLAWIMNYHGFGIRKTSKYRTLRSLRNFVEAQANLIKSHFDWEIEEIRSMALSNPLIEDITFSNIDPDWIVQSLANDLEEEVRLVKEGAVEDG
ncbi:hypothetical protein ABW19_dt0201040 [Dactylella cylindrospora]|nr:hypothetical protein ABW19_dt0201040 [Dactylella cylindrospora]